MVLCICRNVSDREVKRTISDGASTLEEVGRECGAGTDCGTCRAAISGLLACADCPRQTPEIRANLSLPLVETGHAGTR
jgi:bacterioferritin-associated ferredoxin